MLVLNKEFLNVFKKVLKHLDKYYLPEKHDCYSEKFKMTDNRNPKNDVEEEIFILVDIDWDRELEKPTNQNAENAFCKSIIAYFEGDLVRLEKCCKAAHISNASFQKICDGIFSPSKTCLCNLIIAAKIKCEQAVELFKTADIYCYQCNQFDVVMSFFFKNEIYDFGIINTTLYLLDFATLI